MKLLILTFLLSLSTWAAPVRTMDNVDRLVALRAELSAEDTARVIDRLKAVSLEQGTGVVEDFGGGFLRANLTSSGVATVEQWPEVTAVETEGGVQALGEAKDYRVRLAKDLDETAVDQLRAWLKSNLANGSKLEYFKRFRIVMVRLTPTEIASVRNLNGVVSIEESTSEFSAMGCKGLD